MAVRALSRLGHALLSVAGLSVLVFLLARLSGDPIDLLLPEAATLEDKAAVTQQLGLDQPLYVQYLKYIGSLFRGDLGTSIVYSDSVTTLIGQRLPRTLALAGAALVVILLIGVPLGVYSAYRRGRPTDRFARVVAALGQAAPQFWVGLLVILVFAVRLGWFPAGGYGGAEYFVLPAFSVALAGIAGVIRLVRSGMIEALNSEYVRFLRIKGLPEWKVLWKHAMRNAGSSALTYIGVVTSALITGSVVTETVFAWPGLGQLMIQSLQARDFPVLQGIVLIFSVVYIAINLMVDLLYVVLNPSLSHSA